MVVTLLVSKTDWRPTSERVVPESDERIVPRFCTACGRSFDSSGCPLSHDTESAAADIGIGRVVTYRRSLRTRFAVVVGREPEGVVVLEQGARGRPIIRATFEEYQHQFASISSPFRRLERLARVTGWAATVQPWLDDGSDMLLATVGDRRLYAAAAVAEADTMAIARAGLPDSELTWLRMHERRSNRDFPEAVLQALQLPPDAYPDHLFVMVEALSHDGTLGTTAEFLNHVRASDPSFAVHPILAAITGEADVAQCADAAKVLDRIASTSLTNDAMSIATGAGPIVETNVWAKIATGASISNSDLVRVHGEFPGVADDLIDTLRVSDDVEISVPVYLLARTSPGLVADADLAGVGAHREIARRAFVSEDRTELERLAKSGIDGASDLLALDSLRRGEIPDELPVHPTARAVGESIRSRYANPAALADPSTWSILSGLISDDVAVKFPESASRWMLSTALANVYDWSFEEALDRARDVLKVAIDEPVRDEALNVIAFALYQQGRDEEAIRALEKALEDDYSANLQANIGIVAAGLEPEMAAHHLARLADEAPNLDLKVAAIRHAFGVWSASANVWDDDTAEMPVDLKTTMRDVLVSEISYEDYVPLIKLVGAVDPEWLAIPRNTDEGPHRGSAARKVYMGRAVDGPDAYVNALADLSKGGLDDDWFQEELSRFVDGLREAIFDDMDNVGPAVYAFEAIDRGIKLTDFDYVTLAAGAVISILGRLISDKALPSDKVVAIVKTAKDRAGRLSDEGAARVQGLVSTMGNRYAWCVGKFHAEVYDDIIGAIQGMAAQLHGVRRGRVNWDVVETALRPMRQQLDGSNRAVKDVMAWVDDDEMRSSLAKLILAISELRQNIANARTAF